MLSKIILHECLSCELNFKSYFLNNVCGLQIGRRLFRQRLETGDRDSDVEQRRVGHMCYYC